MGLSLKIEKQFSNARLSLRNPRPNLAARWEGMALCENLKSNFYIRLRLRNPRPNLAACHGSRGVILFPFFIEKKDVIIAEISYNNTNKGKTAM
jgi:hypothetical protein